jgi:hypothetical protein
MRTCRHNCRGHGSASRLRDGFLHGAPQRATTPAGRTPHGTCDTRWLQPRLGRRSGTSHSDMSSVLPKPQTKRLPIQRCGFREFDDALPKRRQAIHRSISDSNELQKMIEASEWRSGHGARPDSQCEDGDDIDDWHLRIGFQQRSGGNELSS